MEALCRRAENGAPVVLIAPPHMLATLRAARDGRLPDQMLAEIDKDLTHCNQMEIASYLQKHAL